MGIAYQELNMNILFKKTNRSLFTAEKMTTWTDSHTGLKKESLVELVSSRKKLKNNWVQPTFPFLVVICNAEMTLINIIF